MKNNIESLFKKVKKIVSDLLHGGYGGNYLEEHTIEELTSEMVDELNLENSEDIKKALKNMYYLGKLFNIEKEEKST